MESQLFDWDGWDILDTAAFIFYKVKLKQRIGEFEVGSLFSSANIDFQTGKLELYEEDNVVGSYNLILSIKD